MARATASTKRRRLVRIIKKTVLKTTELKEKHVHHGKTEIYHNCFYNVSGVSTGMILHLNNATALSTQGVGQDQRVGDEIYTTGFKVKMLIGQKADRPNVNWRWIACIVPKGSSISYGNWFTSTTSNVMLDDPNKDFVKVIARGFWRPNEAGLTGGTADEYTFTKQVWVPYKRHLKFGPAAAAITHNDDDLYFVLMGYDAFGSLITDNIGYVQAAHTLYYRDP